MLGAQEKKDEKIGERNDFGDAYFTGYSRESWYKVENYWYTSILILIEMALPSQSGQV